MSRYAPRLTAYLAGVGVAAFVALVLAGLSFRLPHLVLLVIGYGATLALVGVAWLYVLARADGWELVSWPRPSGPFLGARALVVFVWALVGFLILLVTAVAYCATNPERGWRPGALTVLGALTLAAGLLLLPSADQALRSR
jgi:hypothetical protein